MAVRSVEVDSEGGDGHEEVLLHDGDEGDVVLGVVPELAGAHADAVASVLADHDLHHVFVPLVEVERLKRILRFVGQLLGQTRQLVRLDLSVDSVLDHLLDHGARLLHTVHRKVNTYSRLEEVGGLSLVGEVLVLSLSVFRHYFQIN